MKHLLLSILILLLTACSQHNTDDLHMADIYTDGMVLQRDVPLTLHGKAAPGAKVHASLAGQRQTTISDIEGSWALTFDPLSAGGPHILKVSSCGKQLLFHSVMIGEVWLCSGQSNMEFTLSNCNDFCNALQLQQGDTLALLQSRNNPLCPLRIFNRKALYPTNNNVWDSIGIENTQHFNYLCPASWETCTPSSVSNLSAIAFYFGCMLQDSLQVPVGLIVNAVGGTPTESWIDHATLTDGFPDILTDWLHNPFIQDWCRGRAALNLGINLEDAEISTRHHPYEPCYMYNAGIVPLDHYPVRGVIWYQGESNAHNTAVHERLFPLLVQSWRAYWKMPDMPFLYVQLSSLNRPTWPLFRDSQRRLLDILPHTGMAVSTDMGDSTDVHPRHKQPVGERLARLALANVYDQSWFKCHPSAAEGPLYQSVAFKESEAILTFRYAEGLHTSDGAPLRTFEIADSTGSFQPAEARIEGDRIVATSPNVSKPTQIRYGWQPFTRANLVNAFGLPASTFASSLE